jgi:RNA polymerase sigma-70 factor (ECF subfamily)
MNEITLLWEFGPDAPAAQPSALSAARAQLLAEIDGSSAPRRTVRRYGVGIAAAAIVTSGLLAVQLVGGGTHRGASAEAATILGQAAAAAAHLPTAAPGQYYYTRRMIETATGVPCLPPDKNGNTPAFSILVSRTETQWLPASDSGSARMKTDPGPAHFLSASDAATAEHNCPDVLARYGQVGAETSERIVQAPIAQLPGAGPFQRHDAASLAMWPRDPRKLVALLLDSHGAGRGAPAEALVNATDLYGDGASIPADLRSAIFKAMALIPGIAVVDEDVTSDGRQGVGFAVVDSQGERTEVVIDPSTGLVISVVRTDSKTGAVYLRLTEHYGIADSLRSVPTKQY